MKYIARVALEIAGVSYAPGSVVELFGRVQAEHYGDAIVPITDPTLIRVLEVNAHPYVVLAPFRWGRVDYVPDLTAKTGLLWAPMRSMLKHLPPDAVRPATGDEVLAWLSAQGEAVAAPADPAAAPGPADDAAQKARGGRGRREKVA